MSRGELEERAERLARSMLNVGRERAFKMLDQGRLRGTVAGARLEAYRDLLAK